MLQVLQMKGLSEPNKLMRTNGLCILINVEVKGIENPIFRICADLCTCMSKDNNYTYMVTRLLFSPCKLSSYRSVSTQVWLQ